MDPITFLTYITVILLLGVLSTAISRWLKLPDVLLFILLGLAMTQIQYKNIALFDFPTLFITSISILALAMIVFDSTSRINLKRFDSLSLSSFRLILTFLVIMISIFSLATHVLFGFSIILSILFASAMAGTAPSVILPLLGEKKNKVVDLLKLESLLNTPLTVLLPFLFVDIIMTAGEDNLTTVFLDQLAPFLTKFVSGLGAGLLVGIVLFKILKRLYSKVYAPMAVMIAALLSYVLAEQLGGNGVLSVTTLGLFVGNVTLKEKVDLLNVNTVFAKSLHILVFVLVGYLIRPLWEVEFISKTLLLFAIYLFLRFVAVQVTFFDKFSLKEKVFMTCVSSKGIAVSVVAIVLANTPIAGLPIVVDLILLFVLYSIILASLVSWGKEWFLDGNRKEKSLLGKPILKLKKNKKNK